MLINPNKQLVYGGFGTLGYQPNYGSAGPYKLEIPQPCIEVNKTLQYEFRVLESVKDGEVTKIGLQVKTYEVDHNGNRVMICDWIDVERVRLEV
jgi:hypothetical protein